MLKLKFKNYYFSNLFSLIIIIIIIMNRFTYEESVFIVKTQYKCGECFAEIRRKYGIKFDVLKPSYVFANQNILKNLRKSKFIQDQKRRTYM